MTLYKITENGKVPMTDDESAEFESGRVQDAQPLQVTRFQARAALAQAGLFDAVDAMMQDTQTPIITRLEWQDKQTFKRDSATVQWAATQLGLTSSQVDALFLAASQIQI